MKTTNKHELEEIHKAATHQTTEGNRGAKTREARRLRVEERLEKYWDYVEKNDDATKPNITQIISRGERIAVAVSLLMSAYNLHTELLPTFDKISLFIDRMRKQRETAPARSDKPRKRTVNLQSTNDRG